MEHYAFDLDSFEDGVNSLGMFSCMKCSDGKLKIVQSEKGSKFYMHALSDWTLLHCILDLLGDLKHQSCVIQRPVFDDGDAEGSSFLYLEGPVSMGVYLCTLPLTPVLIGQNCLSDISYPTTLHFFESATDGHSFMQAIREFSTSEVRSVRDAIAFYSIHLHGNDFIDKIIVNAPNQNMRILKNLLSLHVIYGAKANEANFLSMTCPSS